MGMQPYILLVDDNDDLTDNLKLVLELEGFTVRTGSSVTAALKMMNEALPGLILADIVMPGTNGYQFFRQIKANRAWASVPFIFLSALTTAEDIDRGLGLGAHDYITKPFAIGELLATINRYL
jgi:DNA-binding response OmpR family regulator